ncbi:MAG: DUF1194 domain-containing protein [Rhizobiales bacterium]|nr:DUF1194 domain-containing protein [Hyphomicrobiales bacterium]
MAAAILMRMRMPIALLVSALIAAWPAAAREQIVDLELVLALDGSSSIDIGEYALQLRGIAAAFRDPAVHQAIDNGPTGRVAVNVVVWAEQGFGKLTTGWRVITSAGEADAFAAEVEALPRRQFGGTGIGEGIAASLASFDGNGFESPRRIIDVSGDGRETVSEGAVLLPQARELARARNVIINGLAILDEDKGLLAYYDSGLRTGPGSFVMQASDFLDFRQAIREKLLRELAPRPLSAGLWDEFAVPHK